MAKGKKKNQSVRCVLTLPLLTEPWQDKIIETRFHIMERIKNILISKELGKLKSLERTREWKKLKKDIEKCKEKDEEEKKILYEQRSKMIYDAGLSKNHFVVDITPIQKHFAEHIATQIAHMSASDVWRSFEKYFYGSGQRIHFVEYDKLNSIACEKIGNGMNLKDWKLVWGGGRCPNKISLTIKVRLPRNDYEREMMQKPIKYLRVVRKWMKTRYKYYLQITFEGNPVIKSRPVGNGRVGIDIGTQTIAWSSDTEVRLAELAAGIKQNQKKIAELKRKMDRSRRAMNPQNYNSNGTAKRGRHKWVKSKRYIRMRGILRELERKNADIRKYEHTCMVNHILSLGNQIYIEDMNWIALARRAKRTKKNKNGRYAKKKRFGKSIGKRAPGMFMLILKQKCNLVGGEYHEVDKSTFKASQYDHITDTFRKKPLGKRWNVLGGTDNVQRDMYSSFLIKNSDDTYMQTDRNRCIDTYTHFKELHDIEIERLMNENKKHLSSMGVA